MNKQVNWGILSTAHINRRLIPVIRASERGQLRAVASRDAGRAAAYAQEWQIPQAYGSYEALLADPEIDVVYISLPNHLHAAYAVKAVLAGKHVLCEKPLCLTTDEYASLVHVTGHTGKHIAEAFMYLHHPQMEEIKAIVDSGKYGRITKMASSFCFEFGRGKGNYRMSEGRGGGCLWDVGVYPISLFQHLTGSEALGANGRWKRKGPVDVSFWGTLEYPGGVTGEFFSSFEAEFTTETSIFLEKGRLDLSHPFINPDSCFAVIHTDDGPIELELPQGELYAGEVEDMHDVVLEGKAPRISLQQSLGHLRTVLALREAAETGKPVVNSPPGPLS